MRRDEVRYQRMSAAQFDGTFGSKVKEMRYAIGMSVLVVVGVERLL